MSASVTVDRRLDPGDRLLGVELLELVGHGRRGSVWRAKDALGQIVTLRALDEGADKSDVDAFRCGVAALNRLCVEDTQGETRIPRLLAVEIGLLAVVEEYVANGDARAIPALGWDAHRIVEFLLVLCRSVSALHRLGMIHGALKPSNVLVDDNLAPMLSDPRKVAQPEPDSPIPIADAIYRAPEELLGAVGQAPATDVYSLGQLLAFLLAGGDVAGTPDAVRALKAHAASPPGLVRIVRKATAVDPQARYQSVDELIQDLERYQQSDSVGLPSTSPALGQHVVDVVILPAQPPTGINAPSVDAPRRERPPLPRSRDLSRSFEIGVGLAGVATAVLATLILAATPLPSLPGAAIFGAVFTASLALATFLVPRYEPNPLLQRAALLLSAVLIYPLADPGALALLRWKHTLRNGSLAERAAAATRLVQRGSFDLAGANLPVASLVATNLGEADLSNANLAGADLTEADLSETNLAGANVRGANLAGADLHGSNIALAAGFSSTSCDAATTMPERWSCANGRPARREERRPALRK